jgi:hypothetical protein
MRLTLIIHQAVKHAEEEKNKVREEKKRKAKEERARAAAEAEEAAAAEAAAADLQRQTRRSSKHNADAAVPAAPRPSGSKKKWDEAAETQVTCDFVTNERGFATFEAYYCPGCESGRRREKQSARATEARGAGGDSAAGAGAPPTIVSCCISSTF